MEPPPKMRKRFYHLKRPGQRELAPGMILQDIIRHGQSTGWQESEPGEEETIAHILAPFNIHPGSAPGVWTLRSPHPGTVVKNSLLDTPEPDYLKLTMMRGLRHISMAIQKALQQAGIAQAALVLDQRLKETAVTNETEIATWFADVCRQVAEHTQSPIEPVQHWVKLALCRLAGVVELNTACTVIPISATLLVKARQGLWRKQLKPIADLTGLFIGNVVGVERCVRITRQDEQTLTLQVLGTAATPETLSGELIGPPVAINLKTGAVTLE